MAALTPVKYEHDSKDLIDVSCKPINIQEKSTDGAQVTPTPNCTGVDQI